MPEIPDKDSHKEIIRLETSDDNDYTQSEIGDEVGRVDSVVSTVLKKYRQGEYLHPDTDVVQVDPSILEYDDWIEFARYKMDQGGRGLKVARDILDSLPEDEIGGDGSPNL